MYRIGLNRYGWTDPELARGMAAARRRRELECEEEKLLESRCLRGERVAEERKDRAIAAIAMGAKDKCTKTLVSNSRWRTVKQKGF
jgi:hypothetical protein